jgi:hypothetical protein
MAADRIHGSKSTVVAVETQLDATVVQRRIGLLFCATVLAGVILCTGYLTGRATPVNAQRTMEAPGHLETLASASRKQWVVVSVPNPPKLPGESVSPSPSNVAATMSNEGRVPLRLDLIARQEAWVEVETDGKPTYKKLIRAEQTKSFDASERIRMMTGNAPGLDIWFNGTTVARAKRRMRWLEFTKEGARDLSSSVRRADVEPPTPDPANKLIAAVELSEDFRQRRTLISNHAPSGC